jgi:hypothetical protein|tara:strand:- start:135 stop:275 length:141 start_codon:yes stop_codon:yes gene_type:complete
MKHPGYSRTTNQYAQRANTKLSKSSKEAHRQTMIAFAERLKIINSK